MGYASLSYNIDHNSISVIVSFFNQEIAYFCTFYFTHAFDSEIKDNYWPYSLKVKKTRRCLLNTTNQIKSLHIRIEIEYKMSH